MTTRVAGAGYGGLAGFEGAVALCPSYYNVLVAPTRERSCGILYNTRTQAIAALNPEEAEAYRHLVDAEGGSSSNDAAGGECVGSVDASFIDALADAGFLVSDPEAEADWLRYCFERFRYDDSVVDFFVAPTMACNFDCPYCYETNKRPGKMSEAVQDAFVAYLDEQHDSRPFKRLKITWYGGEPLLALDVIESLTAKLKAFCARMGVEYFAFILSNMFLADGIALDRLEACDVQAVQCIVDGVGEVHEQRRVNKSGEPSFERILENTRDAASRGLHVDFRCIMEQGNVESCIEAARMMAATPNTTLKAHPMHDFGIERDVKGAADVHQLSPEAFSDGFWRFFLATDPKLKDYERALAPLPLHCQGSMDRGFGIDELGNVYNCGCSMGNPSLVLFNVTEPPETRKVNQGLMGWYRSCTPLDRPECRRCKVLPLCQGGCVRFGEEPYSNCNGIRYCIEDMVAGYYDALQEAAA